MLADSLTDNFYLNVQHHTAGFQNKTLAGQINVSQAEFEKIALGQVTELWSNYGNLSEICKHSAPPPPPPPPPPPLSATT